MLNVIAVQGRLTKDVELRHTAKGVPVVQFSLACQRDGRDAMCDFIDCVAFRETAQFVSKYFSKGSMALVNGRLQLRQYEDRAGAKRTAAEILVRDVNFAGDRQTRPAAAPVDIEPPADFTPAPDFGVQPSFSDLPDDDGGELPF